MNDPALTLSPPDIPAEQNPEAYTQVLLPIELCQISTKVRCSRTNASQSALKVVLRRTKVIHFAHRTNVYCRKPFVVEVEENVSSHFKRYHPEAD